MRSMSTEGAFRIRGRTWKGLRGMSGKPAHPPLTHMPIGAYLLAAILDIVAFAGGQRPWTAEMSHAAGWLFIFGAGAALLAAVTGLADRSAMRAGTPVRRLTNAHMMLMFSTVTVVLGDLAYRYLATDRARTDPIMVVFACVIVVMLIAAANLGGAIVFEKGFNVKMGASGDATGPGTEMGRPLRRAV